MKIEKLMQYLDNPEDYITLSFSIRNALAIRDKSSNQNLNWSYKYQKMRKLLENDVFIEVVGMDKNKNYKTRWYLNVFDLHKKMEDIIMSLIMKKKKRIFTKKEIDYMEEFKRKRGLKIDRYGYVVKV